MRLIGTHKATGTRIEIELVDRPKLGWKWTVIAPDGNRTYGLEPVQANLGNREHARVKAKDAARLASVRWTDWKGRFKWEKVAS